METVTITAEEYAELKKSERILDALRMGGVENWDWYEESLEGVDLD